MLSGKVENDEVVSLGRPFGVHLEVIDDEPVDKTGRGAGLGVRHLGDAVVVQVAVEREIPRLGRVAVLVVPEIYVVSRTL